jgi:hypothetical protein
VCPHLGAGKVSEYTTRGGSYTSQLQVYWKYQGTADDKRSPEMGISSGLVLCVVSSPWDSTTFRMMCESPVSTVHGAEAAAGCCRGRTVSEREMKHFEIALILLFQSRNS